jgi:hypothetical protein
MSVWIVRSPSNMTGVSTIAGGFNFNHELLSDEKGFQGI